MTGDNDDVVPRLHRALRHLYVIQGATASSPSGASRAEVFCEACDAEGEITAALELLEQG